MDECNKSGLALVHWYVNRSKAYYTLMDFVFWSEILIQQSISIIFFSFFFFFSLVIVELPALLLLIKLFFFIFLQGGLHSFHYLSLEIRVSINIFRAALTLFLLSYFLPRGLRETGLEMKERIQRDK